MKKFCIKNKINSLNLKYILKYGKESDLKDLVDITDISDGTNNIKYMLLGYLRFLIDITDIHKTVVNYTSYFQSGYIHYTQTKNNDFTFTITNNKISKYFPKDLTADKVEFQILKIVTLFKFEEAKTTNNSLLDLCFQMEEYAVEQGYILFWGRKKRWHT